MNMVPSLSAMEANIVVAKRIIRYVFGDVGTLYPMLRACGGLCGGLCRGRYGGLYGRISFKEWCND